MNKKITRALISVSDKSGIVEFCQELSQLGIEILSTGGTASILAAHNISVTEVSDYTGFPEMMDGRVKTLHPMVHGGILGRRGIDDAIMLKNGIKPIDMVIVNLYPFEQTIANPNCDLETAIENIDIGGPTMIRAAAKNHADVAIIVHPNDYASTLTELKNSNNCLSAQTRFKLALKSFEHTARYDTAIATYLGNINNNQFPETLNLQFYLSQTMRYGENPHQKGSFFGDLDALFTKLNGKELSYNNLLDVEAAVQLIAEFKNNAPTFAILKHNNACGVATRPTMVEAYEASLACDSTSAFGGVLIANGEIDLATAEKINSLFCEVVIAPSYANEAVELLKSKANRIILIIKETPLLQTQVRSILNGYLVQEKDSATESAADLKCATHTEANAASIEDMIFANKLVKHTKSNTIVFAKDNTLLASGTGQTSRVDALQQAIEKAKHFGFSLEGSAMASDAFFPFPDCVEIAKNAGIVAVVQPGGSIKDQLSIDYCNANNVSMYMTGVRHFKH